MRSDFSLKTEDMISLDYNSICCITSRIGWVSMKGISSIDVDVILENCPITIIVIRI